MEITDREKIEYIFEVLGIELHEKPKGWAAGGRRFFFNSLGEIERITDYYASERK